MNPKSRSKQAPLRVAMIIQNYHPAIGGAEKQLKSLTPFLQRLNCEVHVITRHRAGLALQEDIDGAIVHRVAAPGPKAVASLSFTFLALVEIQKLHPDIVHAHELLSPATTAAAARRMLGIPAVAKVLGGGCLGDLAKLKRKSGGNKRMQLYKKYIDMFLAVSSEIDRELQEIGVPEEKRCRIANGVDTTRFAPVDPWTRRRRKMELQLDGEPVAVYTGRFATEKRLDQLMGIWPEIRQKHPMAALYLIGTGDEEAKLRNLQSPGVRVVGPVDDVAPYLQAADVFVLPSEREGLSNSMLEAMSCGLPVIATNVGGAVDILHSGSNGFVVPASDFVAFQEVLSVVLADPQYRQSAGEAARDTVALNFSMEVTAGKLRTLYDTLLGNRLDSQDSMKASA